MEAQRLLDAAVEDVHPQQGVVVEDAAAAPLLLRGGVQPLGVAEQAGRRPGGDGGAGVVAGEEQRHQQPGDLGLRRGAPPVLVPRVHEALQHVVAGAAGGLALPGDPGEYLLEPRPRSVAAAVSRGREVREEHADEVQAADEVVEKRRDLAVHVVPDLLPQQAPAGD